MAFALQRPSGTRIGRGIMVVDDVLAEDAMGDIQTVIANIPNNIIFHSDISDSPRKTLDIDSGVVNLPKSATVDRYI